MRSTLPERRYRLSNMSSAAVLPPLRCYFRSGISSTLVFPPLWYFLYSGISSTLILLHSVVPARNLTPLASQAQLSRRHHGVAICKLSNIRAEPLSERRAVTLYSTVLYSTVQYCTVLTVTVTPLQEQLFVAASSVDDADIFGDLETIVEVGTLPVESQMAVTLEPSPFQESLWSSILSMASTRPELPSLRLPDVPTVKIGYLTYCTNPNCIVYKTKYVPIDSVIWSSWRTRALRT